MAKQNILIVDADPESVKVLEVSLKKAGYSVTKASDGQDALEMLGFSAPDLIISDTKMPNLDGFELCTRLKENEETADIPFIFLTAEKSIEDKIRGLELGVEDYLNKPIFIREILVRVNLALQRRQKEKIENRAAGTKSKFSGSLQDMGVVDLLQTIDLGHKSGVIHLARADDTGHIFFKDGQVIDALTDSRKGEDAVYRMLVWSEGEFEIEFMGIDRAQRIELSTQGLLMEGMRRLDEWGRLQEQLPPLTSVFDVDEDILAERLGEIPDEVNNILRHFDGKSPLIEVVDRAGLGDLEALTVITKLFFEGLIIEVPPRPTIPAPAETEAMLSDEALASAPPLARLPSRVVDDAIGPHLSVAALDPLGYVHGVTQSAPPAAPGTARPTGDGQGAPNAPPLDSQEELTQPALDQSSLASDVQFVKTEMPETGPVQQIAPQKIGAPAPRSAARDAEPGETETMLGLGTPDIVGSTKGAARGTAENPESPAVPEHLRATRTLTSKELPDADDIAAVIDAELPPPDDTSGEDSTSTSTSTSGYFEGAAYRASFEARPSYEPAPPADSDPGAEESQPLQEAQADAAATSSEDEDGLWHDDIEDEPAVPSNAKPLLAIILLILVGGLAAGFWVVLNEPSNGDAAAPASETARAPATADPAPTPARTGEPLSGQKERPEPVQVAGQSPAEEGETRPDAPALEALPSSAAPNTPPPEAASGAAAPDTPPQPSPAGAGALPDAAGRPLSPEETKQIKKLMSQVELSGKRRKIELLKKVIAMDPDNDAAIAMLSIELLESKHTRKEAMELAERATGINPDNAVGWLAIGYIHQLNNNPEQAKEAYSRCATCSGPGRFTRECRRLIR